MEIVFKCSVAIVPDFFVSLKWLEIYEQYVAELPAVVATSKIVKDGKLPLI